MEGRQGMAFQGSGQYYLHRGLPGRVGLGPGQPGFSSGSNSGRPSSNPSQTVVRGSSNVGHGFNANDDAQGFSITVASGDGVGGGGSLSDPVKKKRGRPRKYAPDGPGGGVGSGMVALGLLPLTPNSNGSDDRRKRGRPPGSGRKQRLASVGEWMNNSAGIAFTPHVIHVASGEDIASKILAFSQERPRALCIMSGSGGVSAVTLRQPASSAGTVSFEGRFEILCLSGSYLMSETGSSRDRVGGVNVSLSSPDGHVIGGAVGGRLTASKPVQVVVSSFVYESAKGKSDDPKEKSFEQVLSDKASGHMNSSRSKNVSGPWPNASQRYPKTEIDLASG